MIENYKTGQFYDEMIDDNGKIRAGYKTIVKIIQELGPEEILRRQSAAEKTFRAMGITFNVYKEGEGVERIFPFDIVPRIINAAEWSTIEKGLQQRLHALNLFIHDVYNEGKIVKDGVVPKEIVYTSTGYQKSCVGIKPLQNIWCHISGIDLIKDETGENFVLEDNLQVPSGVSYVLENRALIKRTFPVAFEKTDVRPVSDYPLKLLETLQYISKKERPNVVVLTPGIYNSAYFEHSFLAQQMGAELVEGRDLVVYKGYVYMKTTKGLEKVDVIYRRIDDNYLDPKYFNSDSLLGVRGLFDVYKKRRVALVNAPGTGVADDKVIYAFVPKIIKYYLQEDPILSNVPTLLCWDKKQRDHVLDNIHKMVIKHANQSGGYGMLVGPQASDEELKSFKNKILNSPRNYIAQKTMSLSKVPTIVKNKLEGRHVDLRPYVLYGENITVMPGGLTRVALKKGSLIVNSSQGGGSKDTWVLRN